MSTYAGYFINLERSLERRHLLEANLAELGLEGWYQRSAAVEWQGAPRENCQLSPGEIGCFASHVQLLERIAKEGRPAHVVEDDSVLSRWAQPLICDLVGRPDLGGYDIVFTDTFVPLDPFHLSRYARLYAELVETDQSGRAKNVRQFVNLDLREVTFCCTSSYVVTPSGAARLVSLLREDFERGPTEPVDITLRKHFRKNRINVTCLFPFATGVRIAVPPSIEGRDRSVREALALEYARNAFFLGADHSAAAAEVARTFATPLDPQSLLLSRLLQFVAFAKDR